MKTTVEPHDFEALFQPLIFRRPRNTGLCKRCYLPRALHPTMEWSEARPLGDYHQHPLAKSEP